MNKFLFLLLLTGLSACATKELPIPKRAESTNQVSLGIDYNDQVYYSLAEGKEVSRNERTSWDLAFESSADGYHIYLNSAKFMYVWNTGQTNMEEVTDTIGFGAGKKMEPSGGLPDSAAIGDWRNLNNVYLIDRGVTAAGSFGFVKVQFLQVTEEHYTLVFQDLSGGEIHQLTVNKDELANSTFVSLNEAGYPITVEPPKDKWDICFTQYSVEIPIPYMVTGVLTNRYQTSACLVPEGTTFEEIDLAFAQQLEFNGRMDNIGYDWKVFDLEANTYVVDVNKIYVVKTSEGFYYKIHFVDFYNELGEKGNPKWQAQRL